MRGDWVEVLVDVGGGARAFEIAATKAGRRVEISTGRGMVEVAEVTRSGQVVRFARFMANRIVAIVEHPAPDSRERTRTRRDRSPPQPPLGLDDLPGSRS